MLACKEAGRKLIVGGDLLLLELVLACRSYCLSRQPSVAVGTLKSYTPPPPPNPLDLLVPFVLG